MHCQNMSFWMRPLQLIKDRVIQSEQSQLNQDQRHMKEKQEMFLQSGTDLLLGRDFHHDRFHRPHQPSQNAIQSPRTWRMNIQGPRVLPNSTEKSESTDGLLPEQTHQVTWLRPWQSNKNMLSSIVFRRKSPTEREELCNRRIDVIQREIDTKHASAQKCENKNADLHLN